MPSQKKETVKQKRAAAKQKKKNSRMSRIVYLLTIFSFMIVTFVVVATQNQKISAIKSDVAVVEQQIKNETKQNDELKLERQYMDSDAFIEKIAREQLSLVKPDEIMYINVSK